MVKSAYIHIPFCKSKCHYCSFVSFCNTDKKDDYIKKLVAEIKFYYENEPLKTLYIGGGTPSLLSLSEVNHIVSNFSFCDSAEITMELNPEDVCYDYLRGLYDLGINRLSFGCQTFDDDILKLINRRHNSSQVIKVVENARLAGFDNLSLDFIYGLPNQSCEMFVSDLNRAVDLGLEHISLYGLKIEEGCYFSNHLPDNLPDDDMQADMYLKAIETLLNRGYVQYEVSNFSKKGLYSRHNLNYWENGEYYGFGVAAHGYKNGIRYENVDNLKDYINNPYDKKSSHLLSQGEKLEEEIFLGFRKLAGIDVVSINKKYNIDFENKYKKVLDKYINLNLIEKTNGGYKLTIQGILVSNVVLADFIE